jgi:hypothetical protein
MVARLKLKEIDGRAPPGVTLQTNRRSSSAPESSLKRWVVSLSTLAVHPDDDDRGVLWVVAELNASRLIDGNTLKLRGLPKGFTSKPVARKRLVARLIASGMGKT